jgi:hypothetical protein
MSGRRPSTRPSSRRGKRRPNPPVEGALPGDQINLTDEDSRIMPVAGGGFEQCYNAQAAAAADSLPSDLGKPETLLADAGYFSEANVALCAAAQIDPMIAQGRQSHHPPLSERFAKAPPAPENPTSLEAMSHRLQTPAGQKLYALRKQAPEPVFGIIKSVMGFRVAHGFSPSRLQDGRARVVAWAPIGLTAFE